MSTYEKLVPAEVFEQMVTLRRTLHREPELSLEEEKTAQRIAAALRGMGLDCKTGVGGHGVVADLPGENNDAPAVALRADMDALPIHEATGLPFSSEVPGVMHACGHDGHTSALIGATRLLLAGPKPPVPVRLLWQPAEEKASGALAMIEDGVLEGVGMIFGGHLDRHYPAGQLIVSEGPVNAASDTFHVRITGRGGHGARPHEALDAVLVGSLFVTSLQTIVSREVDPAHPSVLSVGAFHAGQAPNVIAGQAVLSGTIRAQSNEVREQLHLAIKRVASAVGNIHGAQMVVEIEAGTPPVINLPAATAIAAEAARLTVGDEGVRGLRTANMGGEDFANFLEHVPGCYIRFGAQVEGREAFPAHSSQFDFDEAALATAARWYSQLPELAGRALLAD